MLTFTDNNQNIRLYFLYYLLFNLTSFGARKKQYNEFNKFQNQELVNSNTLQDASQYNTSSDSDRNLIIGGIGALVVTGSGGLIYNHYQNKKNKKSSKIKDEKNNNNNNNNKLENQEGASETENSKNTNKKMEKNNPDKVNNNNSENQEDASETENPKNTNDSIDKINKEIKKLKSGNYDTSDKEDDPIIQLNSVIEHFTSQLPIYDYFGDKNNEVLMYLIKNLVGTQFYKNQNEIAELLKNLIWKLAYQDQSLSSNEDFDIFLFRKRSKVLLKYFIEELINNKTGINYKSILEHLIDNIIEVLQEKMGRKHKDSDEFLITDRLEELIKILVEGEINYATAIIQRLIKKVVENNMYGTETVLTYLMLTLVESNKKKINVPSLLKYLITTLLSEKEPYYSGVLRELIIILTENEKVADYADDIMQYLIMELCQERYICTPGILLDLTRVFAKNDSKNINEHLLMLKTIVRETIPLLWDNEDAPMFLYVLGDLIEEVVKSQRYVSEIFKCIMLNFIDMKKSEVNVEQVLADLIVRLIRQHNIINWYYIVRLIKNEDIITTDLKKIDFALIADLLEEKLENNDYHRCTVMTREEVSIVYTIIHNLKN